MGNKWQRCRAEAACSAPGVLEGSNLWLTLGKLLKPRNTKAASFPLQWCSRHSSIPISPSLPAWPTPKYLRGEFTKQGTQSPSPEAAWPRLVHPEQTFSLEVFPGDKSVKVVPLVKHSMYANHHHGENLGPYSFHFLLQSATTTITTWYGHSWQLSTALSCISFPSLHHLLSFYG